MWTGREVLCTQPFVPHPHPIKLNPGVGHLKHTGEIHYVHDEYGGTLDGFGIELGPHIDVDVVSSGEVSEIQALSSMFKSRSGDRSWRCFWRLPLISAHPPADNPHFSNAFGSANSRVMTS